MSSLLKRIKLTALFFSLLLCTTGLLGQDPVVNEFMLSNSSVLQDYEGEYSDWIEIFNPTAETINLGAYYLSDDEQDTQKWVFPDINLLSFQYLIVFASGKDIYVSEEIHTNFKIKQSGEDLILSNSIGEIVQNIQAIEVPTDYSYSCIPDGDTQNMHISCATPGSVNMELFEAMPSHVSGYYQGEINVSLSTVNEDIEIYYTLNGALPSVNSKLYSEPIHFDVNNHFPIQFSYIPTTPLEGPWPLQSFVWKEPVNVKQAHVLRYAVFQNGEQMSHVNSHTYFVGDVSAEAYSFPVLSLITDSLNLFQYDTGIYIPGKKFDEIGFEWYPYGNYRERGAGWERNINVAFFEDNGDLIFEADADMRIRGAGSTANPQKSFAVYFKNKYGKKKIEHAIFPHSDLEDYKRLIFRSSGNDFLNTHFRDALLQDLLRGLDLELQSFRPSVLFVNGEYWGIHNIREKYDEYYFKYHFDIHEDSVNVLSSVNWIEEGEESNYPEINDFLRTSDMSLESSYSFIEERVDIPNMIDFLIAEIYYANYDWPCNNYRKWRTNDPDSKWRFLINDLDLSFGFSGDSEWDKTSLNHALENGDSWPNCGASNHLFRKMMENQRFVDEFLVRFIYHLNITFNTETVINKIDEFTLLFEPEMEEHIARWGYPSNMSNWYEEIEVMKDFARRRPCFIKGHIMDYFQLDTFDFDCDSLSDTSQIYYADDFQVYPNPSNGEYVYLEYFVRDDLEFSIDLYTNQGSLVYSQEVKNRKTPINISGLSNGVYVIRVRNSKYSFQYKLVIAK